MPVWEQPALLCVNYSLFTAEVMKVSDRPVSAREVTKAIWAMCQGIRGVGDYAIVFHTLAAEGGWSEESLLSAFLHGLTDLSILPGFLHCFDRLQH